jgi:glycosyltransferase involved in cell wall biosynthesis
VALVVPNLVDYIVASTKRVLHFARHADRSRFRLSVVVTENLSQRDSPMFPFGCSGGRTEITGAHTLNRLRDLGVPVYLAPRSTRFVDSARDLALRLDADGVDVVLAQSSLACPIDWLALHMARVPVKAAIHTGCSLFMPGMDVTFFDNPANLDRECAWWRPENGERVLLPKGADLDEMEKQSPYSRSSFGIPESATVIGTLSNHLRERLSGVYMDMIADVLRARPEAWFLAFGSDSLPDKLAHFHARAVADRIRFGGRQSQAESAIKVLDIYANEFPVGGSQSVIEAMACGVPVVALRWSDAHAGSVGAEMAGPEFSFDRRSVRYYAQRLLDWIDRPEERRAAARTQRRRAETRFSVCDYVTRILENLRCRYAALGEKRYLAREAAS